MNNLKKTNLRKFNVNDYRGHGMFEEHYLDLLLHKQALKSSVLQDEINTKGVIDKTTFKVINGHVRTLGDLISATPFIHEELFGSIDNVKIKNNCVCGIVSYVFQQIDGDSLKTLTVVFNVKDILTKGFNITVYRKLISSSEEEHIDVDICKEMELTLHEMGNQWLNIHLNY